MRDWSAPMLREYEERAALFEYLGNARRIQANNYAFDFVVSILTERTRPMMARVSTD